MSPKYEPGEKRPRTFYGDPSWSIEKLMESHDDPPPEVGDELCDGHQMHYEWDGQRWR